MSSNPIPRTTQKIFAGNAPTDELAVFGSMSSGNPQYTTNVETLTNSNAYSQGFQDAVVNGEAPFLEETNGLFYAITSQLAYLYEKGLPEWDAGTTYYTNSFCQYQGNLYQSTIDDNLNLNPSEYPAQWRLFNPAGDVATTKIGDPIVTLSNTLEDGEIWLEGAEVSRTTYANLFGIYGTTYGEGDGSTTFVLPDTRNRVFWGSDTFGYGEAGLPNITGELLAGGSLGVEPQYFTGAFSRTGQGPSKTSNAGAGTERCNNIAQFNAQNSNECYGNSDTVQPPSIYVRIKTRYQ